MRVLALALAWGILSAAAARAQPPLPPSPELGHPLMPDGYIRHWLVVSPLLGAVDAPVLAGEPALAPLPGDTASVAGQSLPFRRYACSPNDPAIRFPGSASGTVGYAVSYVTADLEWKDLRLLLGSDGGVTAWLNGAQVAASPNATGPDQVIAERLTLTKGVNRLVLKVAGGGGFWATARFADSSGNPMPDLFVSQRPSPADAFRPTTAGGVEAFPVDAQGRVCHWLVLAPFPSGGALDTAILPDEANTRPRPGDPFDYGGKALQWTPYRTAVSILDFVDFVGGPSDGALGYGAAYVACEDAMENLTMRVGADDISRIYLNGRQVMVTQSGWYQPDKDQAGGITLDRGLNVVLAKTLNSDHLWQTSVRFTDAAGDPVTDLSVLQAPAELRLREPRVWPGGAG